MNELKKKAQVILLQTNDNNSNIVLFDEKLEQVKNGREFRWGHQHLYILSDDKIKEGDYRFSKIQNNISKATKTDVNTNYYESRKDQYFKVIATTDSSLLIEVTNSLKEYSHFQPKLLPQPSKDFIQKYITAYNVGNPITEVMVEYENYSPPNVRDNDGYPIDFDRPKVNSSNEISISKVKDNYTREEVITLLLKVANYVQSDMESAELLTHKWIKENL
jgi:hypothetical protein